MTRDTSHYFDWAATSPADEDILKEALDISLSTYGNPSSIHTPGSEAKAVLDEARTRASAALGVKPETLFFTSGGTESDHIPLLSVLTRPQKGSVVISGIEHPALREQAAILKNCGWRVITVNPDTSGFVTPEAVTAALADDTAFVSVMAANNETGAVQPIYAISDALTAATKGKRRPRFHVDCVQACGKIPLDLAYKGIDSAAFSAHKICGPRGIGLLYLAQEVTPFLRGGGQEKNIRSGTENLFGAVAFSRALERYWIRSPQTIERLTAQIAYTADFTAKLCTLRNCTLIPADRTAAPKQTGVFQAADAHAWADGSHFSPWVVQAAFAGIPGQVMVRALNAKGFFISTGSACSAKKASRPILEAMHVPAEYRESAVRFSFGAHTTKQAMDELFSAVSSVCAAFTK